MLADTRVIEIAIIKSYIVSNILQLNAPHPTFKSNVL